MWLRFIFNNNNSITVVSYGSCMINADIISGQMKEEIIDSQVRNRLREGQKGSPSNKYKSKIKYDMDKIKSMQLDWIEEGRYDSKLLIKDIEKYAMMNIFISKIKDKMLAWKNGNLYVFYSYDKGYEELGLSYIVRNKPIIEEVYDKYEQSDLVGQSGPQISIRYDTKLFEAYRNKYIKKEHSEEQKKLRLEKQRLVKSEVIKIMKKLVNAGYYGLETVLEYKGNGEINNEITEIERNVENIYKLGHKGDNLVYIYSKGLDIKYDKLKGNLVSEDVSNIKKQLDCLNKVDTAEYVVGKDKGVMNKYNMDNMTGLQDNSKSIMADSFEENS